MSIFRIKRFFCIHLQLLADYPSKLQGTVFDHILILQDNQLTLGGECFKIGYSMQINWSARNKHKLSFYGCFVFWSETKQLTGLILRFGSVITESGHPICTFLSEAPKMVTFVVNFNRHFVFCLSCVKTSTISCLLTLFCIVIKSAVVQSSINLSKSVLISWA